MDEIPPEVPGYRLTRLLGTGSTSTVWRARREADDELVAVKVLPGEAPEALVREYSMLQHAAGEHVITLHETLALDGPDGPATALVLELLAGGSLAEVVAARGHLTPGETVTVIAPVAQALAGLHDLGVVHGDLSPGNVLLDSTGRPSLTDLGFSRLTGEAPGEVHGTDGYVAPEVLDGADPTRACDVYALAALAWLCLTGRPPGHIAERIDLASAVDGSPELVAAVEAGLSTEPGDRSEADELAVAVFDAAVAEPLRMTSPGDVGSSLTRRLREAAEGAREVPEWQRDLEESRPAVLRRRWWQRRRRAAASTPGERAAPAARHAAPGRHAAPRRPARRTEGEDEGPSCPTREIARRAVGGSSAARLGGALAVVALAALLAVLVPWQQLASAGGGGSQGPAPRGAGADPSAEVLADRDAARRSPIELARELTALRQDVVVDLDDDALAELAEPGSPEERRGRELLERLRESGERYRGVELEVRSARLERTSGSTAVLRTTTGEGAYEVIGGDGERRHRPARRGQQVDLVLVWHEEAWRVRDVRAV